MVSAILFQTYNDFKFFFSFFFLSPPWHSTPRSVPDGALGAGQTASDLCNPDEGTKKKSARERKGGLFQFDENFVSTSWRDSWGPLLPQLASPRLAGSSPARSHQAQGGIFRAVDLREPTIWFLAWSFLGEISGRV